MKSLRAAIVDDEPLARARMKRLIAAHDDIDVVGIFQDALALIEAWRGQPADVLFLDIEMPEIDGFSAFARLQPAPQVVFVTAYAEHAVRAFDIDATDYLVKPVAPERLALALERVRAARPPETPGDAKPGYPSRLALPIGRRIELVDVNAIDSITAQSNYVEIRSGARSFVLRKPLTAVQDDLDPQLFVRVHRSVVVRSSAVTNIEPLPSGRFRLRLANGEVTTSGRSYREAVRLTFGLAVPADDRET